LDWIRAIRDGRELKGKLKKGREVERERGEENVWDPTKF